MLFSKPMFTDEFRFVTWWQNESPNLYKNKKSKTDGLGDTFAFKELFKAYPKHHIEGWSRSTCAILRFLSPKKRRHRCPLAYEVQSNKRQFYGINRPSSKRESPGIKPASAISANGWCSTNPNSLSVKISTVSIDTISCVAEEEGNECGILATVLNSAHWIKLTNRIKEIGKITCEINNHYDDAPKKCGKIAILITAPAKTSNHMAPSPLSMHRLIQRKPFTSVSHTGNICNNTISMAWTKSEWKHRSAFCR